jgi:WD40 repeat protein
VGSGVNITRSGGSITMTFGYADCTLRLWTVSTGAQVGTVDTGSDALTTATFSSDWGKLVTGSTTGLLRFFNR